MENLGKFGLFLKCCKNRCRKLYRLLVTSLIYLTFSDINKSTLCLHVGNLNNKFLYWKIFIFFELNKYKVCA